MVLDIFINIAFKSKEIEWMSDYFIGLLKISDFVFTCGYAGIFNFL